MPTSCVYGTIPVRSAVGVGSTDVAAFHDALAQVGLEGYNLIRLSSVIPAGTAVDSDGFAALPAGRWGDRLYCVYARADATQTGVGVWAGVGWTLRLDGSGGLFVEHCGPTRHLVEAAVAASLKDMTAGLPGFGDPQQVVAGGVCAGRPMCALVIAPYETEPWRTAW